MKTNLGLVFGFLLLLTGAPAWAADEQPAMPEEASTQFDALDAFALDAKLPPPAPNVMPGRPDVVSGPDNAPVKIAYYFSLDCKTCARSWQHAVHKLQKLSKEGLVQLHYNVLYVTERGRYANAFMLCVPPAAFLPAVEKFYAADPSWTDNEGQMLNILSTIIAENGLDEQKIHTCMDQKVATNLARKIKAQNYLYYGIVNLPVYDIWGSPYRFSSSIHSSDLVKLVRDMAQSANKGEP